MDEFLIWANANLTLVGCIGILIILVSLFVFFSAFTRRDTKYNTKDNNESDEEDCESKKECIFQEYYDDEEKYWQCNLTQDNIACDKTKCPLWR